MDKIDEQCLNSRIVRISIGQNGNKKIESSIGHNSPELLNL